MILPYVRRRLSCWRRRKRHCHRWSWRWRQHWRVLWGCRVAGDERSCGGGGRRRPWGGGRGFDLRYPRRLLSPPTPYSSIQPYPCFTPPSPPPQVGAPAHVGLVAPIDVMVPPSSTGLDPSQTSFFQVLNIPAKINKGTIEIITPVDLIKKGDKVGSSETALLAKIGIKPFLYGLVVVNDYDNGSIFSPELLDLTKEDLIGRFAAGVSMVTSLSVALSYPTFAAASHVFINAYKNVLFVVVITEYSFLQAESVKEYLKDPSKPAGVAPATATANVLSVAAVMEEKKDEFEEFDE